MRISDWSSDVCSSDLLPRPPGWRDVARHFFTFAAVSLDRFLWLTGASRTLHVASFRPPEVLAAQDRGGCLMLEIGRASGRESVGKYVLISVVAVSLKKKTVRKYDNQI